MGVLVLRRVFAGPPALPAHAGAPAGSACRCFPRWPRFSRAPLIGGALGGVRLGTEVPVVRPGSTVPVVRLGGADPGGPTEQGGVGRAWSSVIKVRAGADTRAVPGETGADRAGSAGHGVGCLPGSRRPRPRPVAYPLK